MKIDKTSDAALSEFLKGRDSCYSYPGSEWGMARDFWMYFDEDGDMPNPDNPEYEGLGRCWSWKGKMLNGYAVLKRSQKYTMAHRFSYQFFFEEIPDGMVIRHRCDNKICTNPDHLEIGTRKQNTDDYHRRQKPFMAPRGPSLGKNAMRSIAIMDRVLNRWTEFVEKSVDARGDNEHDQCSIFADFSMSLQKAFLQMVALNNKSLLGNEALERNSPMQAKWDADYMVSHEDFLQGDMQQQLLCYG